MKPDKDLEKSIYYQRKASAAWYCNHNIRSWIYNKLSKHYEEKHKRKVLK